MIKTYFKTAWRSLLKNRVTALINIGGLSIGMTAAILILIWVQNELNFDNYHADANQIYRMTTSIKENNWTWESTPLLLAAAAKRSIPEIEMTARLNSSHQPIVIINGNPSYEKKAAYVDGDWFHLFHYDFIDGNANDFEADPYHIILTESAAKKYFGRSNITGQTIRLDSADYKVAAVVRDASVNSSFSYNAYIPVSALLKDPVTLKNDEDWGNFNYITFAKLSPNTSIASVEKKLTKILPDNAKEETTMSLTSLRAMHFENDLQNNSFPVGNKTAIYVFSALAFLLLLIACINYVNLTTAKASLRAKEVSVRKIVGAKRIHLFYQFIAESLLISMVALAATFILLRFCLPFFNSITEKEFVLSLTSPEIWKVAGVTLAAAFILNSFYPALLLSSFQPMQVFRGFTILKMKDSMLRKTLVVLQFSISIMLIAGTIIICRQMQYVQKTDPGYNRSQTMSFYLPHGLYDSAQKASLINAMKNDLLSQPAIQSISMANQSVVDLHSRSSGSADWDGHDKKYNPDIFQLSTDAGMQETMGLQMKEGRWFSAGSNADRSNVVLNEAAVQTLKIRTPVIGQRFSFKGRTGQIIGVVKDFKYQSMHSKTGPLVAFSDPRWFNVFVVRTAPGAAVKGLQAVQSAWKQFVPGSPLEYSFLDDSFNKLYKADQRTSFLILVFACIAVLISALGLFGLVTFTAEQRIKEIGIRKVLGATAVNITTMLSKDFVKLVCVAIVIASPIAFWAMNKWIQDFAYRIDIRWWMFGLAGVFAMVIALCTVSVQAVKAALANPVKSLRTE